MKSPIRYYAQDQKAFAQLKAQGAAERHIYRGWIKCEHWSRITMRKGEVLGVVDGFRSFGLYRQIKAAVKQFHDQGATIFDCITKQDSRAHSVELFDEATGPRKVSAEYAKLLADEKADARRKKDGKMAKHDAERIWFTRGLKTAEKAKITGWSRAALYNVFKRSNCVTGRPPKQDAT